jgi:LysM repeat protein
MMRRTSRAVLVLLVLAAVLVLLPAPALAVGTIVLVDPPSQSVDVGQTVSVDVKVDSVTNLYGLDVRLAFDAAKLEVQDANGSMAGIQVEPGSFLNPAQGFMAENSADNTAGEVRYVFTLTAPAPAASGSGVLARITFRAKASGTAAITLSEVTLLDNQVQPIAATLMDGSVTVLPVTGPTPTATLSGTPAPTATKTPTQPPPGGVGFPYTVQWGDTVFSIARRFGVTPDAIVAANGLANPNYIRAGQVLIIPTLPPPPPGPVMYVVQPGDNLYRISLNFKVPIEAIIAVNRIINPWYIRAGQVLIIPTGVPPVPPPLRSHVVRPGDTVWAIAAMYRVTPWAVISLNNLVNPNLIFVGQVLMIP